MHPFIRLFAWYFRLDMTVAEPPDVRQYASLNALFTRSLQSGCRPLDKSVDSMVSPVDGCLMEHGRIDAQRLFSAKQQRYRLVDLLAGDTRQAERLEGGYYAILYLSPCDYHRVHMPLSGTLQEMAHIRGTLFSVSPTSVAALPGIWARNERLLCRFQHAVVGDFWLVMVGAVNVSAIETVWAGALPPPVLQSPYRQHYSKDELRLSKGMEMGRFNMGSTVILLLPGQQLRWSTHAVPGEYFCMGQTLARWHRNA